MLSAISLRSPRRLRMVHMTLLIVEKWTPSWAAMFAMDIPVAANRSTFGRRMSRLLCIGILAMVTFGAVGLPHTQPRLQIRYYSGSELSHGANAAAQTRRARLPPGTRTTPPPPPSPPAWPPSTRSATAPAGRDCGLSSQSPGYTAEVHLGDQHGLSVSSCEPYWWNSAP